LLARAQERALAAGASNVAFVRADAGTHRFAPPPFDGLFSRFGVMFFDDPVAAFANLRGALAPGGRLAFVCWRSLEDNPWASVPFAAARPLLPPQPPVEPHAPGPFAFGDGERLRGILARAGFRDIVVEPRASAMTMGENLDAAADEVLQIGPLARAATELDDATRAQIRERVRAAYAPFATASGVSPPAAVWLVGGR
jgi:SAM-dependent methyltransferase